QKSKVIKMGKQIITTGRCFYAFAAMLLLPIILSIPSCSYSDEFKAVNANNEFSLSIPSWLKKESELKPGAVLQYANRYRNFYLIGETEAISERDISTAT